MNNDIKQIGTKVYYCNITGNVLKVIGDMRGYVKETSFEQDCAIYNELNERDVKSIGLIQHAYGEFSELTKGSTGFTVDLETGQLVLTFEPLPQEPQEPTEIEIMQNKISILEAAQKQQDKILLDNSLKVAMLEFNSNTNI